ncbi:acyl-CoA dehydrogenase family protein [Paenibacillus sp.]|uniref:acyl-CoA dehydrogenase family protein n=1 Tax=Paenibacillus sp. TaxID=58172 RepID=UPI00356522BE
MNKIVGGSFLVQEADLNRIVTPEDFTEEQRMIAQLADDFVTNELEPLEEEMEHQLNVELTKEKLRTAGELGLLSAEVPERYEGLDVDKVSALLINEKIVRATSFFISYGGQTGIGSLPIVFFGNDEQKRRYLPGIAAGEKLAAYALTEASSGTDALGAKTHAKLSGDGAYYILNGTKQFISGSSFADVFIVFAKVNGTDFSAFIVERSFDGLHIGPEEKKMGLKGSSTCSLTLEDVKVPVENLLGEVGKGHLIAFNILNLGRLKLAAGGLGLSKAAIEISAAYANERKQFDRPIASFPLIGKKLADMNIRTFALESMIYRTAGLLDEGLSVLDHSHPNADSLSAKAISEYALECSINKVFGSEVLDFVVDEGLQIHGGYGYIQEYRIERMYRDSRIFRIFEGTNEINRMLIPDTLVKRAFKGELPLLEKPGELQSVPSSSAGETLELEARLIANAKHTFQWLLAQAVQRYDKKLSQEQEIAGNLADIVISIYAMESVLLRTKKMMARTREDQARHAIQMTIAFVHETVDRIASWAKEMICAVLSGDALLAALAALTKATASVPAVNLIDLKRSVASRVIDAEKYVV